MYSDSQVAGSYRPLHPKVDHSWFKVAHNYELLALQAWTPGMPAWMPACVVKIMHGRAWGSDENQLRDSSLQVGKRSLIARL